MQVATEVERLRQDIERISGTPGQLQALCARKEELRAQFTTLQLKYSENKGILQNLSTHLKDRIQALANPAYRQLELNIVDLAIQFNISRDMATQLNCKHDAIEAALMQYHHAKMAEINR